MENNLAFRKLFLANIISSISQGVTMIAIPWMMTVQLGYQSEFGIFYSIITLISCFWSLYAGVIIDRYNRRNIFIVQSILGLLILASASFVSANGLLPAWLICSLVFMFTSFVYNIHFPNIYAFAQEMSSDSEYEIVISKLEIQGQFAFILGGALAGIILNGATDGNLVLFGISFDIGTIIPPFTMYQIYLVNAIAYFLAILILRRLNFISISPRKIEIESVTKRFLTGWSFLKKVPSLLFYGWFSLGVFICVIFISFYLMPVYVSDVLKGEAHIFASSELYFALGSGIAGYTSRFLLKSLDEVQRTIILFIISAGILILFCINKNLAVFFLLNSLFGYANASIRFYRVSLLWKIIPNQIIGRASSVLNISSYLIRSLFGLIFSHSFFTIPEVGVLRIFYVLIAFVFIALVVMMFSRKKTLALLDTI